MSSLKAKYAGSITCEKVKNYTRYPLIFTLKKGAYMKLRLITAITLGVFYVQAHADTPAEAPAKPATVAQQPAVSKPAMTIMPATTMAQTKPAAPVAVPKITVDKEKVSYGIGVDLGQNFKAQGIEIEPAMLERGLKDAMTGSKMLYTQQELASSLIEFQKQLIAKRQAEFASLSAKNLQQSDAFLQANKTKPGVTTIASGLQYKVITAGSGNSPTEKDTVTVDYVGSLPNGQVFDSSYKRGKPVTFPVTEVIPGWTQALQLMKPGATYEVFVPANLGYGERGLPPVIGPNQALVFKIHLIAINPAPAKS